MKWALLRHIYHLRDIMSHSEAIKLQSVLSVSNYGKIKKKYFYVSSFV